MKHTFITLLLLISVACHGQEVKYKVTNNDPVTGKRMLVYLTGAPLKGNGAPDHVTYLVKLKEADDSSDAIPINSTERAIKAVSSYEERFEINDRKISSVTRLYLPRNTQDPNAITLQDYFATKVISSFPGTNGGDQAWKFAEGILREVVLIKQANGEMPN